MQKVKLTVVVKCNFTSLGKVNNVNKVSVIYDLSIPMTIIMHVSWSADSDVRLFSAAFIVHYNRMFSVTYC